VVAAYVLQEVEEAHPFQEVVEEHYQGLQEVEVGHFLVEDAGLVLVEEAGLVLVEEVGLDQEEEEGHLVQAEVEL